MTANRTSPIEKPRATAAGRWWIAHPRAILVGIFLAVAAVTALGVYAIEKNARELEQAQINKVAQTIAGNLDLRGKGISSYLKASGLLFAGESRDGSKVIEEFAADLNLDTNYRGAMGMGWIAQDALASQPTAQSPAGATYFVPAADGQPVPTSLDVTSDPSTLAAMQAAKKEARPVASAKVDFAPQTEGSVAGFAIFAPSYSGFGENRELAGFAFSWFNADEFLVAALEGETAQNVTVSLYDGVGDNRELLASNGRKIGVSVSSEQRIEIANRDFLLVTQTAASPRLDLLSMITLLFGISVAVLLTMLARLATKQTVEDQARLEFFEEQHSIRKSLTRELNHRVKNTLANVLSILALTRRRATDLDQLADSLDGRIRSLSATHDLLTRSEWGAIRLRDVVEAELRHVRQAREFPIVLEGPDVDLAPSDALSFGLAVHELTTNAAKFGALSEPGGSVRVTWTALSESLAQVEWIEEGGPPVASERKRGFGTDLIEKIVAHELSQSVSLEFAESGVRCVMRVPLRQLRDFQIRDTED